VTRVATDSVHVGEERIETRTVFWAAGNQASPLSTALGATVNRTRHVQVEPDLSIPGTPSVFVVGDQAVVKRENGTPVPGVAQGALQMGRAAARNVLCDLRGAPRRPFHYRNRGDLAVIGRYRAVAQFPGGIAVSGVVAWLAWLFIHIMYLAGFRNRLSVLLEWAYAYFTWQRGVRLVLRQRATEGDDG
jgi:NADH dehydrogenase